MSVTNWIKMISNDLQTLTFIFGCNLSTALVLHSFLAYRII